MNEDGDAERGTEKEEEPPHVGGETNAVLEENAEDVGNDGITEPAGAISPGDLARILDPSRYQDEDNGSGGFAQLENGWFIQLDVENVLVQR